MKVIVLSLVFAGFCVLSVVLFNEGQGWLLAFPFVLWLVWKLAGGWADRILANTWADPMRNSNSCNHFWSPALTRPPEMERWPVRVRLSGRFREWITIAFAFAAAVTVIWKPVWFGICNIAVYGVRNFAFNVDWRPAVIVLGLTAAVSILLRAVSFRTRLEFSGTQLWHRCPWGNQWTYFKSIQRIYIQPPPSKWRGRPQLILVSRHGSTALDRTDQEFVDRLTTACLNARVGNDDEMARQWKEMSEDEWLAAAERNGGRGSLVREEVEESVW